MVTEKPVRRRFPKVPIERRAYAFLIDFIVVWLTSSFLGTGILRWLTFLITWFLLRVLLVEKNQGQSLGRWVLDIKIIDKTNRVPTLANLAKREGIVGSLALLAMIGLNIGVLNPLSMLILITPLVVDCVVALGDEQYFQAFHDQISQTLTIQTQRGFSLDLRLKKLLAQIQQTMRK
jgi:uncharacterized RDD family membrane protein YckC